MNRSVRAAHAATLVLAAFGFAPQATAADRKPNILVIVADDMGFADIGVHGCKDIPTPHIDSLAKNGLRFTNFFNTARCCPSRASLMTGLYSHQAPASAT